MGGIAGLVDDLIYTKEEKEQAAILKSIADKPAVSNWIYVIPVAGLIVFGILIVVVLKKRNTT